MHFTRIPHIAACEQVYRFKIGTDLSQRPLQALSDAAVMHVPSVYLCTYVAQLFSHGVFTP